MKKLKDNYRTEIVKGKGIDEEAVRVIAERLYVKKYKRIPVFPNGIKSWVNAYVKTELPILEAAYIEFASNALCGDSDQNRHGKSRFEQHTWAMQRRRHLIKLHHGLTKRVYRL